MQPGKRVEVLVTCQSLLKFLNLCNRNGVYIRNVRIPNILLVCIFLSPLIYELITIIWFLVETEMELQRKSNLMCIVVAGLQVIFTYITMLKSNKLTMETIDHIQQIVDKRESYNKSCYHFI